MGDKVRIKVVAANLSKRQLDYEWVPPVAKANKAATGAKPAKKAKAVKPTVKPTIKSKKKK